MASVRTINDMVQQEVLCCMSHIVATLAQGGAFIETRQKTKPLTHQNMVELCEQAFELACPIADYEEAAIQEGWESYCDQFDVACWKQRQPNGDDATFAGSAQELCEWDNIDPYDREVFEHWAVTDWLADELIEQGEKVDKDFGSLCIWARTCSGQGIASDGVIERIYAKMMEPG